MDYIRGPEFAGFAQFLLDRDVSKLGAYEPAPHTADKDIVREETRGGWEAWLIDAWDSCAAPFERDAINLRECLAELSEIKSAPRVTLQQLSTFLRKRGGGILGRVRVAGSQVRLCAVRDFERVQQSDIAMLYTSKSASQAARAMAERQAIEAGAESAEIVLLRAHAQTSNESYQFTVVSQGLV